MKKILITEQGREMSLTTRMPFIPKIGDKMECLLKNDNPALQEKESNYFIVIEKIHRFSENGVYQITELIVTYEE